MPQGSKLSDREKWEKIFNTLVQMLTTQRSQLESLIKERKLIEERINLQHSKWVDDVRFLEDKISQLECELAEQEKFRSVDISKLVLVMTMKNKEAVLYKVKLEHAETELAQLKAVLDHLANKNSDLQDISPKRDTRASKRKRIQDCDAIQSRKDEELKTLAAEVSRLKNDYEKLALEKNSEISALLVEKEFESKVAELEEANRKISSLVANMEQFKSLNKDKDDTIAKLQKKLQNESKKWKDEISRLSKELDSSKRSHSASATPKLKRCKESTMPSGSAQVSGSSKKPGKESRNQKGKEVSMSETPKLFSASFKVPKLKSFTVRSR